MAVVRKEYKFIKSTLPIPYDLVHIIIQELLSTSSLNSLSKLSLLSKQYHSIIIPLLYTKVHIKADEQLQSFLTIPLTKEEIKIKRTNKLVQNVLGTKRARSGSIKNKNGIYQYNKLNYLDMCEDLTLDIYPSRTSFKLSSKLPQPLQADTLKFTNLAMENLYEKLSKSGAPRILVSFWAGHLPNLIQPKKIIVDYSDLDLEGNPEEIMKDDKWLDTMSGMGISLQSWSGLKEVELRGNNWFGILPSPGVKVRMIHISSSSDSTSATTPDSIIEDEVHEQGEELVTVNETILSTQNSNEPNARTLKSIENRKKLISLRTKSLIMGLRTSQALYENYNSSSSKSLNWELVDFIPSPLEVIQDEEERLVEEQKEKREILENVMRELDESCPQLMRNYARIGEDGRRELTCLNWV